MRIVTERNIKIISLIGVVILIASIILIKPVDEIYHWEEIPYSSAEKLSESMNSSYIIFKKSSCEYCSKLMKKFKNQAKIQNLSVYIVETSKMTKKEKNEYLDLFGCEYVPVIYRIKNKKIINQLIGDTTNNEIKKFIQETR